MGPDPMAFSTKNRYQINKFLENARKTQQMKAI